MYSDSFSLDLIKRTWWPLKNVWKCYVRCIGEVSPGHSIELRLIREDKLSGWVISETMSCPDALVPRPPTSTLCTPATEEPQPLRLTHTRAVSPGCACMWLFAGLSAIRATDTRVARTLARIHVSFSHERIYSDVPSAGAPQNWTRFRRSPPDLCGHLLQSGSLECAVNLQQRHPHCLPGLAAAGPVPWGVTARARLPAVDSPCHGGQSQSILGLGVSRSLTRLVLQ